MLKRVGIALLAACILTTYAARAAEEAPATAPTTQAVTATTAPATGPAVRSEEDLKSDLQEAFGQVQEVLSDPSGLLDPKTRETAAPKAIPALRKVLGILEQINQVNPKNVADTRSVRFETMAFLDLLGDADAIKSLDAAAASKDADEAITAKGSIIFANWLKANKDAAAQGKVLDGMQDLAKANPQNDSLARTLMVMSNLGPANKENAKRAMSIVSTDLKGPIAKRIVAAMAQREEMEAAAGNLKSSENKPLVIAGKMPDGKAFSTADMKGKVILVDFWATWCGPCKAELPRVKKIYQQFHDKGLEVLGVSNDQTADALTSFIKEDGAMPWPQLFDADAAGKGQWNSNTTRFGIEGIPTMFLIDRNGVLRSTTARENFEEQIPKLLEEKPGEAPSTAPATEPSTAPATQK